MNAKDLAATLKLVKALRPLNPVTVGAGRIQVVTPNVALEAPFPYDGPPVFVRVEELQARVRVLKGTIAVTAGPDGLTVTDGKLTATVPVDADTDPAEFADLLDGLQQIGTVTVAKQLKNAAPYLAPDRERYAVNCYLLDLEAGQLVAADGVMLYSGNAATTGTGRVVISPEAAGLPPGEYDVMCSEKAVALSGPVTMVWERTDNYPDYKRIILNPDEWFALDDCDERARWLKLEAAGVDRGDTLAVFVSREGVSRTRPSGDGDYVLCNGDWLGKWLKGRTTVWVGLNGPNRAFRIVAGEEELLMMPIEEPDPGDDDDAGQETPQKTPQETPSTAPEESKDEAKDEAPQVAEAPPASPQASPQAAGDTNAPQVAGTPDVGESTPESAPDAREILLSGPARQVFRQLSDVPKSIPEIAVDADMPPDSLPGVLLVLELDNLAQQLPGKRYIRR